MLRLKKSRNAVGVNPRLALHEQIGRLEQRLRAEATRNQEGQQPSSQHIIDNYYRYNSLLSSVFLLRKSKAPVVDRKLQKQVGGVSGGGLKSPESHTCVCLIVRGTGHSCPPRLVSSKHLCGIYRRNSRQVTPGTKFNF